MWIKCLRGAAWLYYNVEERRFHTGAVGPITPPWLLPYFERIDP